jgi:hypothetical protein
MNLDLGKKIVSLLTATQDAILEVEKDESLKAEQKLNKATEIVVEKVCMPLFKLIDIPSVPEFAEGLIDKIVESMLKAILPQVVQKVFDLMSATFFKPKQI